jgi:hypothetical protein
MLGGAGGGEIRVPDVGWEWNFRVRPGFQIVFGENDLTSLLEVKRCRALGVALRDCPHGFASCLFRCV